MSKNHTASPELQLIPGEVHSQGYGREEIQANFATAQPDQLFTHLLVQADILPDRLEGVRILPAVTYGVISRKLHSGAVEVVPGTGAMMRETFGSDYFNPHDAIRSRAHKLIAHARHPRQSKVTAFSLPAYLLGNQNEQHLFVGGNESDLETLSDGYAEALAHAYELGSVVIGNEVKVGHIKVDLGNTSLPSLIREMGQTISSTEGLPGSSRYAMLKHAKENLSHGESPDYRPWLSLKRIR